MPFTAGPIYTNTNQFGYAIIETKATIIGQQETLTVNAQVPGGIAQVNAVNVRYPEIYYVEAKPEWIHIGSTAMHGGSDAYNHWMRSTPAYGLLYAAQAFLAAFPSQGKIAVNDMSLPFGGKFDLAGNWTGSHQAHHRGTAVDVRANGAQYSLPSAGINQFMMYCGTYGATVVLHESVGTPNEHVHCQWPNP
ncbi:MAG: hypothetical protein NW208_17440 [Bryobacter sp.]|nr:hypothetical protein [Bryobacter sp.]